MLNVLACIYDFDLLRDLMEQARNDASVNLIVLSALPKDVKIVNVLGIDVCLLECDADQKALQDFTMRLHRIKGNCPQIVYLIDRYDLQESIKASMRLRHSACLYAPFHSAYILRELMKMKEDHHHQEAMEELKEQHIASEELQNMGIPIHLNGYQYFKTAALVLLHSDDALTAMKQLYKETARVHKTTISRVEKTMRDAVDYAYRKNCVRNTFGGKKPTNSQVIHMLCERIQLHMHEKEGEFML